MTELPVDKIDQRIPGCFDCWASTPNSVSDSGSEIESSVPAVGQASDSGTVHSGACSFETDAQGEEYYAETGSGNSAEDTCSDKLPIVAASEIKFKISHVHTRKKKKDYRSYQCISQLDNLLLLKP